MRVVLDTNTLAAGAVAPAGGTLATIIDLWQAGRLTVIISTYILQELERTLAKPYFTGRLGGELAWAYYETVRATAILIPITAPVPTVASHHEDDFVLATAASVQPSIPVSGDKQLQRLGRYQDVTIPSPRAFLILFEQQRRADREEES